MNRRCLLGSLVTAAAVGVPMATATAASGGVPTAALDKVQRTVGQVVSRAPAPLRQLPTTPVTREPSRPAQRPAPAPRAVPEPTVTPQAPARPAAAPAAGAPVARPSNAASAPRARSSAAPAKASGGAKAADPTDAPEAGGGQAAAATEPASNLDSADSGSLPFTGWTLLPVLLAAVLLVLAGIGLRRAVRLRT